MTSHLNQQYLQALKAWHLIEFFQTHTVQQLERGSKAFRLTHDEFQTEDNHFLPWLSSLARQDLNLKDNTQYRYKISLGLFDKSALTKMARLYCPDPSKLSDDEIEQRLELDGTTCFAQIWIDERGTTDFDAIEVSTLPWALGQLKRNHLPAMALGEFDESCRVLRELLKRVSIQLKDHDNQCIPIDMRILQNLHQILYTWAELTPADLGFSGAPPLFSIQLEAVKVKNSSDSNDESEIQRLINTEPSHSHRSSAQRDQGVTHLPILNSFYLRDLELTINTAAQVGFTSGLQNYLNTDVHSTDVHSTDVHSNDLPQETSHQRHADLYTNASLPLIYQKLLPSHTPQGRWPSNPRHPLALMQQFAVNTVMDELKDEGLLSINGPPGTGKTTLLRDVIAANIVARAKNLAEFTRASQALTHSGHIHSSLTDFEMIVASNNNAAVQNISHELPAVSAIHEQYASTGYFRPCANQLLASKTKHKQLVMSSNTEAWGAISASLGSKKNRRDVAERFFFDKERSGDQSLKYEYLNFWEYKKAYTGPSFSKARSLFLEALAELEYLEDLTEECAYLHRYTKILEKAIAKATDALDAVQEKVSRGQKRLDLADSKAAEKKLTLDTCVAAMEVLQLTEPSFWARLFKIKKARRYKKELQSKERAIAIAKLDYLHQQEQTAVEQNNVNLLYDLLCTAEHEYQQSHESLARAMQELTATSEELGGITPWIGDQNITSSSFQLKAPWQSEKLNSARNQVFIASLALHEAWFLEATQTNRFCNRVIAISKLLQNKPMEFPAIEIWQTLFMLIPVVSTTFASVASMLGQVESNQLGWLLIDEAGQATPQSAVGAIHRHKRTLIVGDPLQIEPVFTTPPGLVENIMKSVLRDARRFYHPHEQSVQTLADYTNPYGCTIDINDKPTWIGLPLWVHRRCDNPMFRIANSIAYNDRMIHGNPAENGFQPVTPHLTLGVSGWLNVGGDTCDGQYYPALGEAVIKLLARIAEASSSLEAVFIITPFKRVNLRLKDEVRQCKHIAQYLAGGTKSLHHFVSKNMCTIHQSQGKETDIVILALGCDENKTGGATWATSKPNLINVAITRAKKQLFVVGNTKVWGHKPYTSTLYEKLANNRAKAKKLKTAQVSD